MAFLCRYVLALSEARALRVTDTYSLHRIVYSLFEKTAGGRILFADKGGDARGRHLLILADREPLRPEAGTIECRQIPEAYLSFNTYHFEVVLNPVRRENSSRRLVPVSGKENIAAWLCAKAPSWGFSVRAENLSLLGPTADIFRKDNRTITLSKVHASGLLDVTDRELFVRSVTEGIGRARAFGCGLLQINPSIY